jgi:hypothetical protein
VARKARDYKREYAQRIAKGLAAGRTRSQARGHGADRKGAVGASKELTARDLPSYLGKLKGDRSVKVMATLESGATVEIARGKAKTLAGLWSEDDAEGGGFAWDRGYRGKDSVVSVQVVYK